MYETTPICVKANATLVHHKPRTAGFRATALCHGVVPHPGPRASAGTDAYPQFHPRNLHAFDLPLPMHTGRAQMFKCFQCVADLLTLVFRYETGGRPRHRIRHAIVTLILQFQWVGRDGRNGIKFARELAAIGLGCMTGSFVHLPARGGR